MINKYFKVTETEKGPIIERADFVVLVVVKDASLLLVQQFRAGAGKTLWNVPMGILKVGEAAVEAAHRELREETGYSGDLELMGKYYLAPSFVTCQGNLFLVKNPQKKGTGELESSWCPIEEALDSSDLTTALAGNIARRLFL